MVNEVCANSTTDNGDAIELKNITSQPINLSGWYLSDSDDKFIKYAFPNGTTVNPGGYLVVSETQLRAGNDTERRFALSGDEGEEVWLVRASLVDGAAIEFGDNVEFGASPVNETWGRSPDGTGPLQPLRSASLGAVNGDPRVGPIVISEVNYHPGHPRAAALRDLAHTLRGRSRIRRDPQSNGRRANLADWRLRGGIEFDFPATARLAAGETLLVVPFNPLGHGNGTLTRAFLCLLRPP